MFSQRTAFHLIRDHHVQHGPFLSKASDCLVQEAANVTIRTVDKDGKGKVETSHIDLPSDVSNGFTGTMLLNASPNSGPFKLGLVAPTGKGRLIQLSIGVAGEEPFSPVLGVRRKATVFRIHPELGGIAGVVAPVLGKQPKDVFVWILEGEVPGLVREIGPLTVSLLLDFPWVRLRLSRFLAMMYLLYIACHRLNQFCCKVWCILSKLQEEQRPGAENCTWFMPAQNVSVL